MKASELTVGENFKKNGISLEVATIEKYTNIKSGKSYVSVGCYSNGGSIVNSFFDFKPDTKIK